MTESNCEGNLVMVAAWIAKAQGTARTKHMLGSFEARDRGAGDILGRHSGNPVLIGLLDGLVPDTAKTDRTPRSALRDALHLLETKGFKAIKTAAAKLEVAAQAAKVAPLVLVEDNAEEVAA